MKGRFVMKIKKFTAALVCILILLMLPVSAFANGSLDYNIVTSGDSFTLTLKKDNTFVTSGARVILNVLFPGYELSTSKSNAYFEEAVYHFDSRNIDAKNDTYEFSCKFTGSTYGKYNVELIVSTTDGKVKKENVIFNYVDAQMSVDCIKAFNENEADKFYEAYNLYILENELIILEPELKNMIHPGFGNAYVTAREALLNSYLDKENFIIENSEDVKTALYYGAFFDYLENKTETDISEFIKTNKDKIGKIFDETTDYLKFAKMFKKTDYIKNNSKSFTDAIYTAIGLSYLYESTYEKIVNSLEKYKDFFGIDINYANTNGVSLYEVAPYIQFTEDTISKAAIFSSFKAAVDTAKNIKTQVIYPSYGGSSGGGGGGASYSPSASASVPSVPAVTPIEKTVSFKDVNQKYWAYEAISKLQSIGAINGDENGNFNSENNIKREEFIKILVCTFDLQKNATEDKDFSDCPVSHWSYPYVQSGYQNGIIKGISEKHFGIGMQLKRQDLAVMCFNILKTLKPVPHPIKNSFSDKENISNYAMEAIDALSSEGIINGFEDGTFRPFDTATRAQAVQMTVNLWNYINQ